MWADRLRARTGVTVLAREACTHSERWHPVPRLWCGGRVGVPVRLAPIEGPGVARSRFEHDSAASGGRARRVPLTALQVWLARAGPRREQRLVVHPVQVSTAVSATAVSRLLQHVPKSTFGKRLNLQGLYSASSHRNLH